MLKRFLHSSVAVNAIMNSENMSPYDLQLSKTSANRKAIDERTFEVSYVTFLRLNK